jgi:hypothetical protein
MGVIVLLEVTDDRPDINKRTILLRVELGTTLESHTVVDRSLELVRSLAAASPQLGNDLPTWPPAPSPADSTEPGAATETDLAPAETP